MGTQFICMSRGQIPNDRPPSFAVVAVVPRAMGSRSLPAWQRGKDGMVVGCPQPAGNHACRAASPSPPEVGYRSQRLSEEGLVCIVGLLPIVSERLLPVFWGLCAAHSWAPAWLCCCQNSWAHSHVKETKLQLPVCFGCKLGDHRAVQKARRSPCISDPRREAKAAKVFDGAAPFADNTLARGKCLAPIWLLHSRWKREDGACGGDPLSSEPSSSVQTLLGGQGVLSSVCKSPRKFTALYKSLKRRKRPPLWKERKWWGKE